MASGWESEGLGSNPGRDLQVTSDKKITNSFQPKSVLLMRKICKIELSRQVFFIRGKIPKPPKRLISS